MYKDVTIIAVLNNNHVLIRHNREEKILFGKGIGFNKRRGNKVGDVNIEKIYAYEGNGINEKN